MELQLRLILQPVLRSYNLLSKDVFPRKGLQMPINCYEFQVCRGSDNCSCKLASTQRASLYNADWLRRCVRNPAVLMALRGLAKSGGTSLLDNESVINAIAGQIASGQLRVCQGQTAGSGRANDPGSTSSQADGSASKPFPFTPRFENSGRIQ